MATYSRQDTQKQIKDCLSLLKMVLGPDLLGVYLYGSSINGGLQKYSDLDLLIVSERATTYEEKTKLVTNLLQISGIYMKSSRLPIEMTIVVKSSVNPWRYPPCFDFQYGDWLLKEFEGGNIEPWPTKEMPDLALLITQVLLASKTLCGLDPDQLLCNVPHRDFMMALVHELKGLMDNLDHDTRNALLTYARIWNTVETNTIQSKPAAADWVMNLLPDVYQPVMKRAKRICIGEENEYWDDINALIKPCADFMINKINEQISLTKDFDSQKSLIKIAK
ncbi:MAG: adenylyltransferase [Verrucomicrobia bacterium CG_4_10_14_3_um_filter_43_23]|nr:MAG: adenylyltransferase [Verrucomicrobia bacterium CG1_02_43_26]PIP58590.1 MAG: adenylyltransferase [Verrucomicrobia bacterium CG22_combo_CG10-13_8_21_14_all_43_17]PIX58783.1 MAG: adenylyltransferase [Verrucomicrobia bacterium CG_4_10_14_3_um_filter_43_23]PIY60817.1 MAG: adenylyltransferase [Verrucomicrobia bacterium CG_4_10_14_0_8_um_filter_43_34]PJA43933.1 MAG: adenylyltransferase [Verrucomicrobia bacterium CG_4_9_14_3_um_filter_43_20]